MKAYGYLRESVKAPGWQEAYAHQREKITQLAEMQDYELVNIYEEEPGYSGASNQRPAYTQMIADAIAGGATTIIGYDMMRIGRDLRDFLDVVDQCDKHGLIIELVKERINSADKGTGRLILNILASVAQWEHAKIKERMDRGKDSLRYHPMGPQVFIGKAPNGYRWVATTAG